jgi:hypothetical protein
MTEAQTYLIQLRELAATLEHCLSGVPADRLHERPGPHLNPIGWNAFHLLRIWDLDLNWCCKGQPQLEDAWHRGGFTERSGYNPDGKGAVAYGLGFGYTDAEVDEIQMNAEILQEYQAMLLAESEAYLLDAKADELARQSPSLVNTTQMRSNAQRIRHTIGHAYAHVGEIRYAKGVLGLPDNEHLQPAR